MPSKRNKEKRKEDHCKICGGKCFLAPGTTLTWIHEDKRDNTRPMPHVAMPRSQKQN